MSFVLAIDVEDWAQSTIDPNLPIFDRAKANTLAMLEIAEEANAKATWFVLGLFAEKFPEVVKEIHSRGHEIASHGFGHLNVYDQTIDEFHADVTKSKQILEDIINQPVLGYRAPFFSLAPAGLKALEVLTEAGFQYDSSIFPSAMYKNGVEAAVDGPSVIRLASGAEIIELPPATIHRFGRHWPIAGGGYHRLLPRIAIEHLVRSAIKEHGTFISYFHPYEIDTKEFEEIPIETTLMTRIHQGLGRKGFRKKLLRLLNNQETVTASTLAARIRQKNACNAS